MEQLVRPSGHRNDGTGPSWAYRWTWNNSPITQGIETSCATEAARKSRWRWNNSPVTGFPFTASIASAPHGRRSCARSRAEAPRAARTRTFLALWWHWRRPLRRRAGGRAVRSRCAWPGRGHADPAHSAMARVKRQAMGVPGTLDAGVASRESEIADAKCLDEVAQAGARAARDPCGRL